MEHWRGFFASLSAAQPQLSTGRAGAATPARPLPHFLSGGRTNAHQLVPGPGSPGLYQRRDPAAQLEKTLRFPGLQEAAEALRDNPNPEGYTIKGPKRTCGRLFVPDLTFGKHIEMGENVFFYMGEMAECYVIYWPGKPVTEVHHGEV